MLDNAQAKATRSVQSLLNGQGSEQEAEIEEAAKQMESLFASMLVKELRGSMSKGLFGEGPGSDIYNEWFDKNMGEAIASDGGLGMTAMLKVQLGIEAAIEESESFVPLPREYSQLISPVRRANRSIHRILAEELRYEGPEQGKIINELIALRNNLHLYFEMMGVEQ